MRQVLKSLSLYFTILSPLHANLAIFPTFWPKEFTCEKQSTNMQFLYWFHPVSSLHPNIDFKPSSYLAILHISVDQEVTLMTCCCLCLVSLMRWTSNLTKENINLGWMGRMISLELLWLEMFYLLTYFNRLNINISVLGKIKMEILLQHYKVHTFDQH